MTRRGLVLAAMKLGLCLALTACATTPPTPSPPSLPQAFRNLAEAPSGPGGSDWWRAFGDPALNALEARAMAQNLDIAAAVARVGQARAAARAAGAANLPVLVFNPKASRAEQSKLGANGALVSYFPSYPRSAALYDVTAGASWELDLFGGLRREADAARAERQAADASLAGARLVVAADLADAYIDYRTLEARLRLAQSSLAADQRLLDLATDRYAAGQAPRRDRDAAEAVRAEAAALLPQLRLGLEAERNRIAVLIGETPETAISELMAPTTGFTTPNLPVGRPGDLLRRRPDLIAAERQVAAANARVGAALAEYYPKLSLQGLMGFESAQTSNLFTAAAQQSQGVAGLTWRLFDFGRVDAEVAAARGKTAEALATYRQAALRACADVENALAARTGRHEQAEALWTAAKALRSQQDAAELAYRAGVTSLTELTDAERQRLLAEDQAEAAEGDTARAAVALIRALGGS